MSIVQKPESTTIGALVHELAATYGDLTALVDGERRYTFSQLRDESRAVAKALAARGVGRGDFVAVLMGNKAEWLFLHFGAAMIGAAVVGVNTWSTLGELEYVLAHSDARLLVQVPRFLKHDYVQMLHALRPWRERLPALDGVVLLGGDVAQDMQCYEDFLSGGSAVGDDRLAELAAKVTSDDITFLLYTSGSTSRPKGVLIQQGGLIENMWHIGERLHVQPGERLWLAVSLFWGFGCENAVYTMYTHGGCLVLQEQFEPGEALRLLSQERCSVFYGMPNMVAAIMGHPDYPETDLSALRTGISMGSPEQIKEISRRFLPQVTQTYGMTELYGNCSVGDCLLPIEIRATTGGNPLPGVEMKIVQPGTNNRLPAGSVGELRVRGHVTLGYHKDAELTHNSFDEEGFFVTGDLGVIDEAGFFTFRGRIKEMVKTGGINVSPAEVEEVLLTHPDVLEAFVIGLSDADKGEQLAAVVVLRDGVDAPPPETLAAHVRSTLASYKIPQRIVHVASAELPRTTTGKIQKNRLNTLF